MSFYKTFNKLCKVHDNTIVFRDWLDYSIDQFLINPDLKYFQHDKYNENEYKLFFELFKTWIKNMETRIKEGYKWFDLIGYFYEETRHNNLNTGTINLSETKEKFLENILREISPQLTDKQYNTLRIVLVNELGKVEILDPLRGYDEELKSSYPDMNDDTVLYQIIFELPEFPWELF